MCGSEVHSRCRAAVPTRPYIKLDNDSTSAPPRLASDPLATWRAMSALPSRPIRANPIFQFWWDKVASSLAVLLSQAGYPPQSQYRHLLFFSSIIVPELGKPPLSSARSVRGSPPWKSFMTDDGTPIEFSWDWGCIDNVQRPTIRFSIEPIAPEAGSQTDPLNSNAGLSLMHRLQQALPEINLDCFDHFSNYFSTFKQAEIEPVSATNREQHQSQFFAAFDLYGDSIMVKVYFLPALKSIQTGLSKLDLVSRSLVDLDAQAGLDLGAFRLLRDYIDNSPHQEIEVEILAIDCVLPTKARLKIYVRSPHTSFRSVEDIMTLGDQNRRLQMAKSLEELHKLWDRVTGDGRTKSASEDLEHVSHRTAGILYNFEIQHGKQELVPKVYIPVRHYGKNDLAVMQGLRSWLQMKKMDWAGEAYTNALLYLS